MSRWFYLCLILLALALPAGAKTDWRVYQTLQLDETPVDMLADENSRRLFILTDQGRIMVYEMDGQFKDRIDVGKDVDHIKPGPREDFLYLLSAKTNTVRLISVDLTEEIDIEGAPFKGPADAAVTAVVFSDFQCPYCARLVSILDQLHERYPTQVKIVFKQYPLRSHQYAVQAARATIAAAEQGKFWPFHDLLFQNYNQLNEQKIDEIRAQLELDADRFKKTMAAESTTTSIDKDITDGKAAGVRGTPTLFFNGKMLRDKSLRGMQQAVQQALEQSN